MTMRPALLFASGLALLAYGQPGDTAVPAGVWGGKGIEVRVTASGGTIDYGCDSGTIAEPLVISGAAGKFTARGTHGFGSGGPRQPDASRATGVRARYDGAVTGTSMQLTVLLPDSNRKVGDFTARLGERAILERCG